MTALVFEQFRDDPRVREARRLVLEALRDHRRQLVGPQKPRPERAETYAAAIERLGQLRGRSLALPYLGSGIGNGALVELCDGSVKYDFIAGIGVHFFGHSHPDVVEAIFDAGLRDTVMQGNLLQNEEALTLSRRLVDLAGRHGADLSHCFLTTSGAMANENALKIAFHKQFPADRLLAFEGCFAGRTLALSQVTDRPAYRSGLPPTVAVDYIPFFDPRRPGQSKAEAVEALERHLARHPGRHAAMMVELILGEGGCYPGDADFFAALMSRLRREGIAVVVDEVQTFGRTLQPFAFQHFGLDELVDIVTVGKMTQVCATLFRDAFNPGPGLISQTFTGGTAGILAAVAILEHLTDGGYFGADGRIAVFQRRFHEKLGRLAQRYPQSISGPFGLGAMVAFTPFDGSPEAAKALVQTMFDEGVIGFQAGHDPSRVRFLPPVPALDEGTTDAVLAILERSIQRVAASREGG